MKKIALIFTVASVGAISAMAQGNFVFQNSSAFPVKVATGTDATSLANATVIGTANTTLTGPQVTIELFAAANGMAGLEASSATTSPFYIASVAMSGSSAASFQGTFHGGNPYVLPTAAQFSGSSQIEYAFYGVSLDGKYAGWSAIGTGYTPSTGTTLPGATFGTGTGQIGGWTLTPTGPVTPTPEPTTLALGGLGAAALLFLRRRK
jgi:hypothetical protein